MAWDIGAFSSIDSLLRERRRQSERSVRLDTEVAALRRRGDEFQQRVRQQALRVPGVRESGRSPFLDFFGPGEPAQATVRGPEPELGSRGLTLEPELGPPVIRTPEFAPRRGGQNILDILDVPRREVGLPVAETALDIATFTPREAGAPDIPLLSDVSVSEALPGGRLSPFAVPRAALDVAGELGAPVPRLRGVTAAPATREELQSDLAAEILSYGTDPLNFVPIVGVTKAESFVTAARRLRTLAGPAREQAAARIAEQFPDVLRAARSEVGGGRLAGGGAEEAAQRATAGASPPREPPPAAPPRAAAGPPAEGIPERGYAGAEELLRAKEQTLLRPGRLTRVPGIKQAVSGLNPSVTTDRKVLTAYNARQAAQASLETEFAALRLPVVRELSESWAEAAPRYVGPSDNPIKNTIKDFADNPDFYSGVTPRLQAAARAYDNASEQILARARGQFGVDVKRFTSSKEGAFYLPTIESKEALDEGLKKVGDAYTSANISTKGGRIKTRIYEGAYQRIQRNPGFRPETSLEELTGLHDRALANLAGSETFRLGAGGRTRLEVMQELHPNLYKRMTGLRQRLQSLQGTLRRLNIKQADTIDDFLANPEETTLSDLADALDVTITRGKRAGMNVKAVNAEIKAARQEIRTLRPGWEAANLQPYVLNRSTFRFHPPEEGRAIDSLLQTKLNIGQGLADAIDEVRLAAFAGDVSPLTIQGLLGGLSHPLTTAQDAPNILKALWNPDRLLEIAAREPDEVRRFTVATGRAFGEVGPEFVQEFKGLERLRLPLTQLRPGHALNQRLMAAVEEIRYSAWKGDTSLLKRLNPEMAQEVADSESANLLSKLIPALNPAETGRSVLRARVERVPIISTSFLAAPPALLKDATSGLAKLGLSRALSPAARWQGLSGREQLAILRSLNLAGSLSALTVGSYVASGFSPEEAVKRALDPTGNNPRFLSIALGKDRYIPIGGPVRSFVRALMPTKAGEVEGVPVYTPFTNLQKWVKGKVTPAVKAPLDLARNRDFFGGKIATGSFPENILRAVWYGANSVLPLAIAEPSEAVRRGEVEPTDIGGLAERGGGQFLGSDIRQINLREAFERETGRSWAETPRALRDELIRESDFLSGLAEQRERVFPSPATAIREERSAELSPHAQDLLANPSIEAARAYNDNRSGIMARFSGVSQEVFRSLKIKPKGRDQELLQRYYDVDFAADHNENGIRGDDEDVRIAIDQQDALRDQLSKPVRDALDNPENFFTDESVIEVERRRNEAKKAIRTILDLPKWKGLTTEQGNDLDDLVRRITADVQRYKAQAAREGGDPAAVTFRSTAAWLAGKELIREVDAENAIAVSSGQAIRDERRINEALRRRDVLLFIFPDFFGSVLPPEAERAALTEEEIDQLLPAGVR